MTLIMVSNQLLKLTILVEVSHSKAEESIESQGPTKSKNIIFTLFSS